MDYFEALQQRRSVRGFLSRPVPPELLTRLFTEAQRAPSWCNIQPWRVWLTSGETTKTLTEAMVARTSKQGPAAEIPFPPEYPDPYGQHRKECGKALFGAMSITREDTAGRFAAFQNNYRAFGAPHVAIVAYHRNLFREYGALDVGIWLQSVMLGAQALGLATCAQASLASYPDVVREVLDIPEDLTILCGMSLGYEDPEVPANTCKTDRDKVETNIRFV